MSGFYAHIEAETLQNNFFRKVLFTGPHSQLVLMALQPNEDIGSEVHPENDQFFRFEAGQGKVIIGGETKRAYGRTCRQPGGSWEIVK